MAKPLILDLTQDDANRDWLRHERRLKESGIPKVGPKVDISLSDPVPVDNEEVVWRMQNTPNDYGDFRASTAMFKIYKAKAKGTKSFSAFMANPKNKLQFENLRQEFNRDLEE